MPTAAGFLSVLRRCVLFLATITATVGFSAGLNLPDGARRVAAFAASLVSLILLYFNVVTAKGIKYRALQAALIVDLFCLIGACISGSYTSICVIALLAAVLLYTGIQILVFLSKPRGPGQVKQEQGNGEDAYRTLEGMRKLVLLFAILAATITYSAGLTPPGGIRQDDARLDGIPDVHRQRYKAFFYCNGIAFAASLVLVLVNLLLMSTSGSQGHHTSQAAVIKLVMLALVGAYAAGSCRQMSDYVYILVLVVPVLLYVGYHALVFVFPAWREADEHAETAQQLMIPYRVKDEAAAMERKLEQRRQVLLFFAIIVASLTYQAGLSPARGFLSGHVVGDRAFFYFNATAFIASLTIIALLVDSKLLAAGTRCYAVQMSLILVLIGLMGAAAEDESLHIGIAGEGTDEEPLRLEISSPILGGVFNLVLAVPVRAILIYLAKLPVALLIAPIVVAIWWGSFARLLQAPARALHRRYMLSSSTPGPWEPLLSALRHGLCRVIDALRSRTWVFILMLVVWIPSLIPYLKLRLKISKMPPVSALLDMLIVGTPTPTTAATTATDTSTAATATGTGTPTSSMASRTRNGAPLVEPRPRRSPQPLVEPRPTRNRRPNRRLIGEEWVN